MLQWIIKMSSVHKETVAVVDTTNTLHALHQSGADGNTAGHRENEAKTHNRDMWIKTSPKGVCATTDCVEFKTVWSEGQPTLVSRKKPATRCAFPLATPTRALWCWHNLYKMRMRSRQRFGSVKFTWRDENCPNLPGFERLMTQQHLKTRCRLLGALWRTTWTHL